MANLKIFDNAGLTFNRFGMQIRKHSPEILAGIGVAGTVVSVVMACKATTKVSDILDDTKNQVDQVRTVLEDETISDEAYSEEDSKKDLAIIYIQTGVKLAKLYAPSVILGTLSIGCMLTSNNILRKRNVAIAAAYTAVDTSFKDYRKRVVERFGKEIDKELKYNLKSKKISETVVDDETGKEKKVKETVEVLEDPTEYSDYARFFDDANPHYEKDSEYNLMFLRAQQQYANDLLHARGHLFLNEVYDMLGIPRSKAGAVVGWIDSRENGDAYVDFGLTDVHRPGVRDFVNGYERAILLDFNVDGIIWNLI